MMRFLMLVVSIFCWSINAVAGDMEFTLENFSNQYPWWTSVATGPYKVKVLAYSAWELKCNNAVCSKGSEFTIDAEKTGRFNLMSNKHAWVQIEVTSPSYQIDSKHHCVHAYTATISSSTSGFLAAKANINQLDSTLGYSFSGFRVYCNTIA